MNGFGKNYKLNIHIDLSVGETRTFKYTFVFSTLCL